MHIQLQFSFFTVFFLYTIEHYYIVCLFFQTVLNSSSASDKADEYGYFKVGINLEKGPMTDSLLTAPGNMLQC